MSTGEHTVLADTMVTGANAGDLEGQPAQSILQQSSHPVALIFHVLFRIVALVLYLLPSVVSADFVFMFVISVLLLTFDFWTVKNVTGRLLVGLRWWNEVREDGTNVWIFESRDPSIPVNAVDSRIFWGTLYVTPVVWCVLALISLIRLDFQWLLVVVVAIVLSTANLVGYMRCDRDAKKKWSGLANQAVSSGLMSGLMGNVVSRGVRGLFSRG